MFKILKKDEGTRARWGILETPHGTVETPSYVVVGTHAQVRELNSRDLDATKTQIVIANTYHLWKTLGDEGLAQYPGLHQVMNWNRPIMTDSGGFQVFSLGFAREFGVGKISNKSNRTNKIDNEKNLVEITEDGVYFKVGEKEEYLNAPSYAKASEGGQLYFLSPEKSIQIQQQLGADIIFAFDEPTSPKHDYKYTKESLARTHHWAELSQKAQTSQQLMYGIVQGGGFEDLRRASAEFINSLDFDGLAVGGSYGSSFGGPDYKTFQELDWVVPLLDEQKPRHLLGIGLVEDLFLGVEKGMDTFDCVVPTREGRHGSVYTSRGRIDIKRGIYRDDDSVISPDCDCEVCAVKKITKSQLGEMFRAKNPEAGYLASFHNVYFFNDLMAKIRDSIKEWQFQELKRQYLSGKSGIDSK